MEKKRYIGLLPDASVMRAETLLDQLPLPVSALHLGRTSRYITFEATEKEAKRFKHLFRVLEEVQLYTIPPEPPKEVRPFAQKNPELPDVMEYLGITEIWKDPSFRAGEGLTAAHLDTGLLNDDKRFGDRIKGAFLAPGIAPSPRKHRHGTMSCSLYARQITSDGEKPYQGALFKISLFDIQVLNEQGSGMTDGVAWGIDKAVELGVDFINMSLGGRHSQILDDAIKRAREQGIIVVCAAGNTGRYPPACCGTLNCPADAPDALAVGATDGGFYEAPSEPTDPTKPDKPEKEEKKWTQEQTQTWVDRNPIPWSGQTQENYDVAPGTSIKVGLIDAPASGTSFASPMKCCAIGVCLDKARQVWSGLSKKEVAEKVIRICYETDVDLGYKTTKPAEAKCLQGYGRINPLEARRKIVGNDEPRKGRVTGKVTEKATGQAIGKARVLLDDRSTFTDPDGRYLFVNVEPQEHKLTCEASGYKPKSAYVVVDEGETVTWDFQLEKEQPLPSKLKVTIEGATRILIDEDADKEYEAKKKVEVLPVDASFYS